MEERFTYDNLNRLTGIVEGLDTTGVFAYDGYGRMTMKYIHGDTVFDQTAYNAGGRPHALKTARMYSYQPDMAMAYTSFDKNRKGYKNPMYLGTREGHFWYLNSDWTRGMVNGFDHSSVFFYRQDLYMFYSY